MVSKCAKCGEGITGHVRTVRMGFEWEDYLVEERDLGRPLHGYEIPLCRDCYPEVDILFESGLDAGMLDEEGQERLEEDTRGMLDELDTDLLRDESPY